MPNFKPRSLWRVAAVVGVTLFVSGCVTTQQITPSPYHDYSNLNYLPAEISNQLQNANVGQQFVAASSPWGNNATVYVQERYFSASGRTCLKLSIAASNVSADNSAAANNAVACQYQQLWVLNPNILLSASQG
ncbi:DVU3141 family protein [Alishewanella tabrizica]|nr:DVU3141 family protein [Alishewanella tabrizica]